MISEGRCLDTAEDFDEAVFLPLEHALKKHQFRVSLDSETQRIDKARGFNPFYGVRVACGSMSWGKDQNFAFSNRMKDALLERPMAPRGNTEQKKNERLALKEAYAHWCATMDLGQLKKLESEFEWLDLKIEVVKNIDTEHIIRRLNQLTELGMVWLMKNMKFDLLMYMADGWKLPPLTQVEDAEVQSHLSEQKPWVQGKRVSHKLQDLTERHLGRDPEGATAITDWFKAMKIKDEFKNYSAIPFYTICGPYAWQDTRDTEDIGAFFDAKIMEMDGEGAPGKTLEQLYCDELKLIWNLVRSTITDGMAIDQERADVVLDKHEKLRKIKTKQLYEQTESNLDWGNSDEVASFLFDPPPDGQGLPVPDFAYTAKTGDRSSSKPVLVHFKERGGQIADVCDSILDWRQSNTFIQTFLEPIARYNVGGFCHPDFHITSVRTGRMSSSSPNMQNRPKDKDVRSMFVARDGYVMASSDLDQIEMRIGAHYAHIIAERFPVIEYRKVYQGKPNRYTTVSRRAPVNFLFEGFNSGEEFDPHARMMDISGLPRRKEEVGQITVKEFNFSRLYGSGANGMVRNFGWDMATAKRNIKYWDQAFPDIKHLGAFVEKILNERGWIANEFGRRYYVDRAYLGLNYLLQGCCGDLMKRAMNRVYDYFAELALGCEGEPPARILNVIHDELLYEVREEHATPEFFQHINFLMCDWRAEWWTQPGEEGYADLPMMFTVPITAGLELGPDWGSLEDAGQLLVA